MESLLFQVSLAISATLLLFAMIMAGIRVARGPTAADRVVAIDMLGLLGTAAAGLTALVTDSVAFVDVAMCVAFTGFLTTLAYAIFIERGSIAEDDS